MPSSLLAHKAIAIVGAGPVGLTTAVLLQQRGATVTVYERDADPEARISGGTLDLHADTGQLALQAAGLLPQFYELARPTTERLADHHGRVLHEELPTAETAHQRPEIDRQDLRRLLLAHLAPGTVRWDHHFQALHEQAGRFDLAFSNQPVQAADMVIGASGGRSSVRPYVLAVAPHYTGTFVIQGEVLHPATQCPAFYALANRANLMVRADGRMLYAQTKATGAINYYVSFRAPEDWLSSQHLTASQPAALANLLATELADWNPLYHQAFRATTYFALLPMHQLPVAEFATRQVQQPLTLLGDAAHVMPPFAGVGVNIGLLDALRLTTCLTDPAFGSLSAAIQAYERQMYAYAHQAQEETAEAERDIHSDLSNEELLRAREQAA